MKGQLLQFIFLLRQDTPKVIILFVDKYNEFVIINQEDNDVFKDSYC